MFKTWLKYLSNDWLTLLSMGFFIFGIGVLIEWYFSVVITLYIIIVHLEGFTKGALAELRGDIK